MSEVVSFKVSKEIKKKIDELKNEVNWPDELRRFVELKIKEVEARKNKERIMERLRKASWSVPKGFSAKSVREDRDSH
ncbi:MAG: CopG family transcriptional regulator [Candidatus Methanodesulfokora sp.]